MTTFRKLPTQSPTAAAMNGATAGSRRRDVIGAR
jgi:hypothetical protein